MQFKHPEILFALFLLIIPIIVHLFQLRRFKKVFFTNVKFLKEVELQTRKSSRLKKLLILFTRLLLFAALIISFAQPYVSSSKVNKPETTYIYVDNSFSMQAKGKDGELFKRAVQDIINSVSTIPSIHLYTNNEVFHNLSAKNIKNTLLSIDYHPVKMDMQSILLKIKSNIRDKKKSNNIFLISDFQLINFDSDVSNDSINNLYIIKLQPENITNISIDTVYISDQDNESITIKSNIKSYGKGLENVSVSLFNKKILSGKSTVSFKDSAVKEIEFNIPNTDSFNGKLQLDDGHLIFDNTLFFTINKPEKINITAIGDNNGFLSKIYTKDEFNFVSTTVRNFDYNVIEDQHLLILNELQNIPNALATRLKEFINKGGNLVIIPPVNLNSNSYSLAFNTLNIGSLSNLNNAELAISTINFSHPLLKGVFEKKIKNFQYPTVQSSYRVNFKNSSSILKLENDRSFISQINLGEGKVYCFSSSIDTKNSNFKNSPLIVPIFYNFGLFSHQQEELYYINGKTNTIEVTTQIDNDQVVHLVSTNEDFIPQQEIYTKKVTLTTETNPINSGFIEVQKNKLPIKVLAYNYERAESDLSFIDVKQYFKGGSNISFISSVNEAFQTMSEKYKTTSLWQLFLLFAVLFLISEILLLKFLKP